MPAGCSTCLCSAACTPARYLTSLTPGRSHVGAVLYLPRARPLVQERGPLPASRSAARTPAWSLTSLVLGRSYAGLVPHLPRARPLVRRPGPSPPSCSTARTPAWSLTSLVLGRSYAGLVPHLPRARPLAREHGLLPAVRASACVSAWSFTSLVLGCCTPAWSLTSLVPGRLRAGLVPHPPSHARACMRGRCFTCDVLMRLHADVVLTALTCNRLHDCTVTDHPVGLPRRGRPVHALHVRLSPRGRPGPCPPCTSLAKRTTGPMPSMYVSRQEGDRAHALHVRLSPRGRPVHALHVRLSPRGRPGPCPPCTSLAKRTTGSMPSMYVSREDRSWSIGSSGAGGDGSGFLVACRVVGALAAMLRGRLPCRCRSGSRPGVGVSSCCRSGSRPGVGVSSCCRPGLGLGARLQGGLGYDLLVQPGSCREIIQLF
jgi:hypothetical protein